MDCQADFSYYFDIGSRRRCYVAPERFFEGSGESPKGVLLPSMDIFSAGCVIAELFLDGRALFDLSQVLPVAGPCISVYTTICRFCVHTSTTHALLVCICLAYTTHIYVISYYVDIDWFSFSQCITTIPSSPVISTNIMAHVPTMIYLFLCLFYLICAKTHTVVCSSSATEKETIVWNMCLLGYGLFVCLHLHLIV